jgi:uncharacterized protein YyaL (SSP411 family)
MIDDDAGLGDRESKNVKEPGSHEELGGREVSEKADKKETSEKEVDKFENRLTLESSPYLLQHAHNPVNWHPWSEEAFDMAKKEDKPVFLSIGYSTCHWCHVMAHESFEDPEIARVINDIFVPVKVDREERPDVDQIYMTVCQAMTGRGGWPLTIFLTPDKKPFFAATYIPKNGRLGSMGLRELLPNVGDLWKNDRNSLLQSADKVTGLLKSAYTAEAAPGSVLREPTLTRAFEDLRRVFDFINGGFGTAPKFPTPHNIYFLLRFWRRRGDNFALEMIETTLQSMRAGGIYDHVGFGFHRYSTDAAWKVPHFEKMLYDQALLAMAYAEAFQATGNDDYSLTCREILRYVQRMLTFSKGAFYSAEDADTRGVEGEFYLWTSQELKDVLGEDFALFSKVFDISNRGNFEGDKNILWLRSSLEEASSVLEIPEKDLKDRLEAMRQKLFSVRESRIHPGRDDKILTDWNGLMIAAFAKAFLALGDRDYAEAARKAADYILENHRDPDGRLFHSLKGTREKGTIGIRANLEDYAFFIWGLIELYEALLDARYLRTALDLQREMLSHYWDEKGGGFFFTPDYGEELLTRQKEAYDGAIPSGNAVAALDMLRLSHLSGDPSGEERAQSIFKAFSGSVQASPLAHTMLMTALGMALGTSREVAIVEGQGLEEMLGAVRSRFEPNDVVLLVDEDTRDIAEFTDAMVQIEGKATAYVCIEHSCELPTADLSKMLEMLDRGI